METAFANWFSTLSDSGVCVLHGISLKDQSTGALALWGRLRLKWPSIEFDHSTGLGVLFVGHRQTAQVRLFLKAWQGSREVQALIRSAAELLASLRARMPEDFRAVVRDVAGERMRRAIESRRPIHPDTLALWNELSASR